MPQFSPILSFVRPGVPGFRQKVNLLTSEILRILCPRPEKDSKPTRDKTANSGGCWCCVRTSTLAGDPGCRRGVLDFGVVMNA